MGELGLPGQQLSHLSLKAEHLTPDLTGTLGVPRPLRGPVSPGQWTLSSLSPTSLVGLWKTREHSWTLGLARPLLGHSGPAWETQISRQFPFCHPPPPPEDAGAGAEGPIQDLVLGLVFPTETCPEAQDEHSDPRRAILRRGGRGLRSLLRSRRVSCASPVFLVSSSLTRWMLCGPHPCSVDRKVGAEPHLPAWVGNRVWWPWCRGLPSPALFPGLQGRRGACSTRMCIGTERPGSLRT